MIIKRLLSVSICCVLFTITHAQNQPGYQVIKTFHIQSDGWWDYIAVNGNRLYVSHGTQVNILDKNTGDSVGVIPNTNGVHGIAFDEELNRGYTSNGRANNVTVFDLKSGEVISQIATGQNPDAIMYEPYSKTIITCNGGSKDLTVINPKEEKVIATVPLGGKPETAVSDNAGKLYINNEDKSEIVAVNTKSFKVEHNWSIAPGTSPSGLAIDRNTKRLFAGCDDKLLMVLDASTGKVIDKLPIGDGCDGVAFDAQKKMIYSSNGEGNLTAIQETSANNFKVLGNFSTKRGARTIALDESTGLVYLPTADFEATAQQNGRPKMLPGTFQVLVVQ